MDKIRVLFLAANPAGTQPLDLDEEVREIEAKIRGSKERDSLELTTRWAVRPEDLLQAINEHRPHVVHFAGHGSDRDEILLLDSNRQAKPVGRSALVSLFRVMKDSVRVVVLNWCYSRPQAEAITEVIDCAVGMSKAVPDQAAILFAGSFYRALGFGQSVQQAFDQGQVALELEGVDIGGPVHHLSTGGADRDTGTELLHLWSRPGVDAGQVVLVGPGSAGVGAASDSPKLSAASRAALVQSLSRLSPVDFAMVVRALPGAAPAVARNGSLSEQVYQLLMWAESTRGPGLAAVREIAEEVVGSLR